MKGQKFYNLENQIISNIFFFNLQIINNIKMDEKNDDVKEELKKNAAESLKRKFEEAFVKPESHGHDKHEKDKKKKKNKKKKLKKDNKKSENKENEEEDLRQKIKESKIWESQNIPEFLKEKYATIESSSLTLIIANIPINVTLEELREYFNTLLISLKQNLGNFYL